MFYKMCDEFKINVEGTCNVITYGNAAIKWFSKDINVQVWDYSDQFAAPPVEEPEDKNGSGDWNWRLR